MFNTRKMAWLFALVSIVMALPSTVWCADKATKIGVVDITNVRKNAPRMKQYDEQFSQLQADLQVELDIRKSFILLDESEIKEIVTIKQKGQTATDAEKTRLAALLEKEKTTFTEYTSLQETKNPDANQSARLKALQDLSSKNTTAMQTYVKDANSRLDSKNVEMLTKAENDILQAIKEAAESKGFGYVYDKGSLLYGGEDMTDEVIKRLPRKDG